MAEDYRGPIDTGTMLKMQGAMEAERGFGRMWSAGASETVKAAYMRSAEMKGALAAENIRNRYYKKEFEQILETRIKPLQERLSAAKALRDQTMATTTMPTTRTVSPEEYQERAEALGQAGPVQFQTVPGPTGKKGEAAKQVIPQQPAAPNAALDKQIGAVESEDVLAVVDPVSGSPVPIASPRGISVWNKAENDFWGEYSAVNQELMQIMSEYEGNPYADRYAQSLIDSVIKQSNLATTGKADPLKAQEWMENRQQFEAEQETRQQGLQAGEFQIETAEAGLDVAVREAQQIVQTDPSFAALVGKPIMSKFKRGKSLTRREKFEAANAVRTYRDLQEKELARKRRQEERDRVFRIPSIDVPNPENWHPDMRADPGDPTYRQYFGEERADVINDQLIMVSQMSPEEQDDLLSGFGASTNDIAVFQEGLGTITPGMAKAFENMANKLETNNIANDRAFIRRLPELERRQSELARVIDQTINNAIDQIRASGGIPDEDLIRNNRYKVFFELIYGRRAPERGDFRTVRDVGDILSGRAVIKLYQPELEQMLESPPPEAATEVPIRPTEEELPPVISEEQPETIGAPTVISPPERLPGESEASYRLRTSESPSWISKPVFELPRPMLKTFHTRRKIRRIARDEEKEKKI